MSFIELCQSKLRWVKAISIALLIAFSASVSSADQVVQQQVNGPPGPGPFFWALPDIGWYWTPTADFQLTGIQTQLTSGLVNLNNDFMFVTTLFTDRPDVGGMEIASFSWNGTDFQSGVWVGGSFASPVSVNSSTQYFVGMSGWDNALGWAGAGSGAGINWVSDLGPPAENLGAGSSWGSINTPGSFDTQFSPNGLGTTDQPVIRFLTVPEPSTLLLLTGFAFCAAARRRRN